MRSRIRMSLAGVALATLAAISSPALAKDAWDGPDGYRGPGPGMGGPPEMDKALGVTLPIGREPKSDEAPAADQPVNCGETVTTTLDGSGQMVEHVTPTPCR